jgi:AAA domain
MPAKSPNPAIHWHPTVPLGIAVRRSRGNGPDTVSIYHRGTKLAIHTNTLYLGSEAERDRFVSEAPLEVCAGASIPQQQAALLDLLHEAAQVGPSSSTADGERSADSRADVVTLADIEVEPVRWLWPGRIPYGKLTVLEGDPGLGKSQLTLAIAAAVTTGGTLPGDAAHDAHAGEPGDVLLLTGEDGLRDTVRPRLEAANGDPARVHVLRGVPDPERPGQFQFPSLPEDVTHLLLEIRRRHIRLVIVDTLTTYLGGEYNSFKDADVRRALAPLANVAETTGCAIVLVRHLTKQSRGRAITAGGGSIGIVGGARSCLLLAEDPDSPELRVLAVVKANLARKPDSLTLTIKEAPNGWPRVVWGGTSTHSADDLIAARGEEGEDRAPVEEARELLRQWLPPGRLVPAKEVHRLGREAGISDKTLYRAKEKEKVESVRQGFGESPWFWRLPATAKPPGHAPKMATPPITRTSGHLSSFEGRNSLSPQGAALDGHPTSPVAIYGERPRCSVHSKVPLRRRRHGATGCWICLPPDPKNPYLEPLPQPGESEYDRYHPAPEAA